MKQALSLCSLAVNSSAPSPTASMVKIEDGFMVAFGGLFCVRVPVDLALGCAFNPNAVKTFFRKDRKAITYTVKKNKLVLQEGKEKLSVGCLPPEDMVTLDVIAPTKKATLDVKLIRYVSSVIDPANFRSAAHGVTIRDGMLLATNNRCFIAAYVEGIPDGFTANIHKDACAALGRFSSPVVGVASDGRATKFLFEDGASFSVLNLSEELPDIDVVFEGPWHPLGLSEALVEDLLKIDCYSVVFQDGSILYRNEDRSSVGDLGVVTKRKFLAFAMKSTLDFLLRNGGQFSIDEDCRKLRSVNGDSCVVCSLMHTEKEVEA
jgi:hypothetical protein